MSSLETKRNVTTLINNLKIKEYAKKTTLSSYMLTSDFNTKSTELENKIKDEVTKANSDLNNYAKKNDAANDITTIKMIMLVIRV